MNAMNQIIIEGNVVRDSQIKETQRGTRVATMPIASNRVFKDSNGDFQSEVSFFDVQAWGQKFCESVAKNGIKGRGVRVVGRLKQDRWKNDSGKSQSRIYIIADHIDFKPVPKESFQESESKENFGSQNEKSSDFDFEPETDDVFEKEEIAETVF